MSEGVALLRLIGRARHLILRRLRPHIGAVGDDLSLKEAMVLLRLDEEEVTTPTELAAVYGISPSTMTGILDRLEEKGYIQRDRLTGDRRSVVVRRTEHWRRCSAGWRQRVEGDVIQALGTMDPEDLVRLRQGLEALIEALTEGGLKR